MAETRKYNPSAGDPLGDAVRAAIGETIRPRIPGQVDQPPAAPAEPVRPNLTTLGRFTYVAPKPQASPDAEG